MSLTIIEVLEQKLNFTETFFLNILNHFLDMSNGIMYNHIRGIISPKLENFGNIMLLVPPPFPPSPPSPATHANACTGHNFVTNTPIKFIFTIAIEVPDYKNLMIFGINRKNKMASGGHFV